MSSGSAAPVGQAVTLPQDHRAVLDHQGRPGESESTAARQVLVQAGPDRSSNDGVGRPVLGLLAAPGCTRDGDRSDHGDREPCDGLDGASSKP